MLYSEPLFRPPAEADSLIVQLTEGCAYNRCRFCPMYKSKSFSRRSPAGLTAHLADLRAAFPGGHRRVFLADGDALTLPTEEVLAAMRQVRAVFPTVQRFGVYGSVFSLAGKSVAELAELRAAGLRVVYLGLESGDEATLRRMDKFMPAAEMIAHCRKVAAAGLNLSVMILIGLGGRGGSKVHITASAAMVDAVAPSHTSLLNLLVQHTPLRNEPEYRDFTIADYFRETAAFIAAVECRTIFRADHASNPLALAGVLPRDRGRLLAEIAACDRS